MPHYRAVRPAPSAKDDNLPIFKDMAIWFRFKLGITSSGGTVSQWDDQSGNDRHLKQATGENQPVDGSVGSNLFTGASGTNWSGSGNGPYTHTTGSTADLSAAVLTVGVDYLVEVTVANRTAGSVTPKAGTAAGTAISANGTTSEVLTAAGNTSAIFTPTSTFDGDVTATFKAITPDGSIYFPGVDEFFKCDAFTFNQPETIYLLGKQVTWTSGGRMFTGGEFNRMALSQQGSSPEIDIQSGNSPSGARNSDWAVDTYAVVACVFDGANSVLKVNNNAATTGNIGANDATEFILGAQDSGGDTPANIQVKEIIGYSAAHGASERARNIRYLAGVGGLDI